MKELIKYIVLDRKNRKMGGYSTKLQIGCPRKMAIQNAEQSNGTVFAVDEDGDMREVYPKDKLK